MESKNQYESAYNELKRALRSLGSDEFSIEFKKLDGISCEKIRSIMQATLAGRINELANQVTGAQVD